MQTDAVFENIAERIQTEISKTKHTLLIAVAWFTNKNLFNSILDKAKEGCDVTLIISNDLINENSGIDFSELEKHNGRFFKFGDGESELMHNKFCVIDNSTVITGSYNWSYKAENNSENIVINHDNKSLAELFINEFRSLLKKISPHADINIKPVCAELVTYPKVTNSGKVGAVLSFPILDERGVGTGLYVKRWVSFSAIIEKYKDKRELLSQFINVEEFNDGNWKRGNCKFFVGKCLVGIKNGEAFLNAA